MAVEWFNKRTREWMSTVWYNVGIARSERPDEIYRTAGTTQEVEFKNHLGFWMPSLFDNIEAARFVFPSLEFRLKPICTMPPIGWVCTRDAGHDGPCAAKAVGIEQPEIDLVHAEYYDHRDGNGIRKVWFTDKDGNTIKPSKESREQFYKACDEKTGSEYWLDGVEDVYAKTETQGGILQGLEGVRTEPVDVPFTWGVENDEEFYGSDDEDWDDVPEYVDVDDVEYSPYEAALVEEGYQLGLKRAEDKANTVVADSNFDDGEFNETDFSGISVAVTSEDEIVLNTPWADEITLTEYEVEDLIEKLSWGLFTYRASQERVPF